MYDCVSISLSLSKVITPKTLAPPFAIISSPIPCKNGSSFFFLRGREATNKTRTPSVFGSGELGLRAELGFKEKDGDSFQNYETNRSEAKRKKDGGSGFLEFKDEKGSGESKKSFGDENLVRSEDGNGGGDDDDDEEEEDEEKLVRANGRMGTRKGRQAMRRSSLLAKQVISIRSALSLGFVSQLWVDTTSWVVLFLEVRPNLLSGECERFLLEDVSQVGDVVLVEDETVIENEFKIIGLETLVGYKVVTPGRRNIGKVRGYTFNIVSGAIESLELDSFGISIIPSSLVSTYALLVEDVLEVLSDAVVIHEAAASRIQRLTKGFLDSQNVGINIDDLAEYADFERPLRSEQRAKSSGTRKFGRMNREIEDDWDLPMDYL